MAERILDRDIVRPFYLERAHLRGRFVRLEETVHYVLTAHAYPEPVSRLLAELLVLAGSFVGALKFTGTFSLQIRAEGAIRLMVVDVTNDGVMRGYASFDEEAFTGEPGGEAKRLFEDAVLAITVDQRKAGGQMQQGIVRIDGRTPSEALLVYFRQSEQIPTALRTAVGRDPLTGHWRAAGILLQAMPGEVAEEPEERREDWHRAMLLLQTVTEEELLGDGLTPDEVLFRLFHEEGVRVFEAMPISPGCSCDRERVRTMLRQFPAAELEAMRQEDGSIGVTCQFCSRHYLFEAGEVDGLVAERSGSAR